MKGLVYMTKDLSPCHVPLVRAASALGPPGGCGRGAPHDAHTSAPSPFSVPQNGHFPTAMRGIGFPEHLPHEMHTAHTAHPPFPYLQDKAR